MTAWKKSPYFELPPAPPTTSIVEWDLAQLVRSDTENAALKFLAANPDPMYKDAGTYIMNMIEYARSLQVVSAQVLQYLSAAGFVYAPPGWDPITMAIQYAMKAFATLQGIAVNLGDENSASVYDAWVNHAGQYYGGHLPAAPVTGGTGNNPGTGPSAAPVGILGGTGPQ